MKLRILSKTGGCLAVKDRISLDVDTAWDTAPSEDTLIMFDESGYGKSAQVIQRTTAMTTRATRTAIPTMATRSPVI